MRRLLPLLLLVGCENTIDETPNRLVPDASAVVDAQAVVDGGGACPVVGDWYVFDSLVVEAIKGDPTHGSIPNLNTIWANDIRRKQLNVLFEILEADESHVRVRAMNAARRDDVMDDWCLVTETSTELVFERQGDRLTMTESGTVNIYAGSESIPKTCSPAGDPPHTIPIHEALLETRMEPGCRRVTEGRTLNAVLYGENLRKICSCLAPDAPAEQCGALEEGFEGFGCDGCNAIHRNLHSILESFTQPNEAGERVLYEVGEDGRERLKLDASFTAVRLAEKPADCP